MGTWGDHILGGDGPLDAFSAVTEWLEKRVMIAGNGDPTAEHVARVAAGIGLLLQINSWSFDPNNPQNAGLIEAVSDQQPAFDTLPDEAAAILNRVIAGEGEAIASERICPSDDFTAAVGDQVCGPRFGSLLETEAGRELTTKFTAKCAETLDADIAGFRKKNQFDLYEASDLPGFIAPLLVIEPLTLDSKSVQAWRDYFRAGLNKEKEFAKNTGDAGDLPFWKRWHKNLEWAFDHLQQRLER